MEFYFVCLHLVEQLKHKNKKKLKPANNEVQTRAAQYEENFRYK